MRLRPGRPTATSAPDSTVAIIDTGVDYTHADFGGPGTVPRTTRPSPTRQPRDVSRHHKVAGGYDFAGDSYDADPQSDGLPAVPHPDSNPLDCDGHGSHVAGTAAGYGEAADGSTYTGN